MKRRFYAWQIALSLLIISMTGATSAANITYTYDAAGRLTQATYGGGKSVAYTYDNNGNLLATSVVISNAADCLFTWAERNYPSLFSPAATSLILGPYYYRYYSGTNIYLGVSTDNHVYYLDAGGLHDAGAQSGWFATAGCQ